MGRKNCAVIMLTSACLVLTACAPTEFPEQNGTENQDRMESFVEQELAEFGKDDIEKIPDHLTYQVDDLLTVDADIRLWGLSEWKLSDWYATEKNYTESEEEANRLIKEIMQGMGWTYDSKRVECSEYSSGGKRYDVEISDKDERVSIIPDSVFATNASGYISMGQSVFSPCYGPVVDRELYKTGRELEFGTIKESEKKAADFLKKLGFQVSETADCYTLDEKNKRWLWDHDMEKQENHTPEDEENKNFSYLFLFYQDYFGIPVIRGGADEKITNDEYFEPNQCEVNIDKDGIAWLDTTPAYVSEKMGTEQEILRPADIIEKQVEMMKSKEGTGEMKLSEVSLEYLPVYDKETELYHMCPVWACYYSQVVTYLAEVSYDSDEAYMAIYDAYTGEVLQTK